VNKEHCIDLKSVPDLDQYLLNRKIPIYYIFDLDNSDPSPIESLNDNNQLV
jgi:hypothetical protein